MAGRLLSLLIPAVGGQGGGVLAEWIVAAAAADGLQAHGTSIPGVAQRTGSTTYYVEVYQGEPGDPEPTFSLYPVPGALDVLLAPEFLEVGRMIEQGFPSPTRTTVIASTHRLFTIHEKIAVGRGTHPVAELQAGARAFSRALYAFDALALAREHGTEANAVLLGALAASGAFPLRAEAFRAAIERKGVQAEANLRGFDAGLAVAARIKAGAAPEPPTDTTRVGEPAWLTSERARGIVAGFAGELGALPAPLRPTVEQALLRLVDYQDRAYALRYLDRLRPFLGPGVELAGLVARHLAVWMTYEDAIRVADLKTRASRFARIRGETRVGEGGIVVTDYLKPDLDEIYGILPHRLVAPFARWAERRWPHGRPTLGQRVRTTTVTGYLRVWLLARLRRLRPSSHRAHVEHARMERWLGAVARWAERDVALAGELARAAQLVKGYGEVRRRMVATFEHLLAGVERAADLEARAGRGFSASTALAARYRALVLAGPDGESQARALAGAVVARLEAHDRAGALAALGIEA